MSRESLLTQHLENENKEISICHTTGGATVGMGTGFSPLHFPQRYFMWLSFNAFKL